MTPYVDGTVATPDHLANTLIGNGVHVLAFATDVTIDKWAPLNIGTEVVADDGRVFRPVRHWHGQSFNLVVDVPYGASGDGETLPVGALTKAARRRDGLTWTRTADGDWIGRSFAP